MKEERAKHLLLIDKTQLDADSAYNRGEYELADMLEKRLTKLRKELN